MRVWELREKLEALPDHLEVVIVDALENDGEVLQVMQANAVCQVHVDVFMQDFDDGE